MSSPDGTPSPANSVAQPDTTNAANTPGPSTNTTVEFKKEGSTPAPAKVTTPMSFSEWQLLAVLQKANLVQYFDTFISLGGDDINQIMSCDENEFMEIMQLVGMLSKPLHVRRLQRALNEFSKDQQSFNVNAMQSIGHPPLPPQFSLANELIMPGIAGLQQNLVSTGSDDTSGPAQQHSVPFETGVAAVAESVGVSDAGGRATANIVARGAIPIASSRTAKEEERATSPISVSGDFVSLGDFDPNGYSSETPSLSMAQHRRLVDCAQTLGRSLPPFQPKLIQNKKRVTKDVLDLMSLSPPDPKKMDEYRKYSAIYGRYDTKRNPEKSLSLHEVSVNEAAAQLCFLMPSLLTRRDELFPLARQVVRDAGYNYGKSSGRKRNWENVVSRSPVRSPVPSVVVSEESEVEPMQASPVLDEKRKKREEGFLERWATSKLQSSSVEQHNSGSK